MKIRYLLFCSALTTLLPVSAAELAVQLDGIRNQKGKVIIALFKDAESFKKQDDAQAEAVIMQKAQAKTMHFRFTNLLPGDYAFMVHHDENADQKFDQRMGVPTEGYAYSLGKGKDDTPSFREARVKVIAEQDNATKTKMIYWW